MVTIYSNLDTYESCIAKRIKYIEMGYDVGYIFSVKGNCDYRRPVWQFGVNVDISGMSKDQVVDKLNGL